MIMAIGKLKNAVVVAEAVDGLTNTEEAEVGREFNEGYQKLLGGIQTFRKQVEENKFYYTAHMGILLGVREDIINLGKIAIRKGISRPVLCDIYHTLGQEFLVIGSMTYDREVSAWGNMLVDRGREQRAELVRPNEYCAFVLGPK